MSLTLSEEKSSMRQQYEYIANRYAALLFRNWNVDIKEAFWMGGDIGGVICYGDDIFLTLNEIIFCYENDVDMDTVSEWTEYCVQADELGFGRITLEQWVEGYPRISQEVFDKISDMRHDIYILCKKEKERLEDVRKDF